MTARIDALLFDVGGTLRRSTKPDAASQAASLRRILDLIGSDMPPAELMRLLTARGKAYHKWAKQNLVELSEAPLWTGWMLPDFPPEKVAANAVELNTAWRDACATHWMIPDAPQTILGLYRRGYRLGLVSNTTSSVDVPEMLEKEGIAGCFDAVILSCLVGKRKPGAAILLEAVQRMGVTPERCAYIGNRPDRDVAAARNAGFSRAVVLRDPEKPFKEPVTPETEPDHYIDALSELLEIFPPESKSQVVARAPLYGISLSTMWGMQNFTNLGDFLLAAPRLGFDGIELNHQVSPSMLEGLSLDGVPVISIHEPCPAVIAEAALKKQDLLISSPAEERRRQGVNSIRRSIDLAQKLGVRTIVVHCGMLQLDPSWERNLVALFESGKGETAEYREIQEAMIAARKENVEPCLQAVQKSLHELLEYAGRSGIRLGLENRYHYFDLPSPGEMALLLSLADAGRLGFIYDSGHAQALDRLGFYPHEDWLKRFADRILGSHLHDAVGIHDHLAPGLGEIDFKMIASYLPEGAFRTLEVKPRNSSEQVRNGLKRLVETGCVHPI